MAAQIFPFGTALTVVWHLTKPDGSSFDITGYTYRAYYRTGNKETEVNGTHLSASGNTLSIVIPANEPTAPGEYALRLVLFQNGGVFCTLRYNAAFVLSRQLAEAAATQTQEPAGNTVHLYTVAEFYLLAPVVPTVGTDGYWYVNGVRATDGNGQPVPASHTMEYDVLTDDIIIDRGRVDKDGNSIQQTIPVLEGVEALKDDMQGLVDSIVVNFLADTDVYEQAVEHGFVGTRAEWLASTDGVKGVGIDSIAVLGEVSTEDSAINTYRISMNNGTHFDFPVKNGKGIESVSVVGSYSTAPGAINTYRVTYSDGTHFDFSVKNGTGVTSIEQTTTSTADGGVNVFRVTLSDGTYTDLQVKNGSQGSSGYTGASGELEVVNNLVDGGTTSALSAQQGKTLKGMIQDADVFIHGLEKNLNTGFITSQNAWTATAGRGVCVYVNGISKVKIFRKTADACAHYALLQTNVYETGTLLFCEEHTSRVAVTSGEEITIPDDCNYIWLCFGLTDTVYNTADTEVLLDGYNLTDLISSYQNLQDNSATYTKAMNNVDGSQADITTDMKAGNTYLIALDTWDATTQNSRKLAFRVTYKMGGETVYAVQEYSGSDLSGNTYIVEIPSTATNIVVGGRANNSVQISVNDLTNPSLKTLQTLINGKDPSVNPDILFDVDTAIKKARMFSDKDMFDMESKWMYLEDYLEEKYAESEQAVVDGFIAKFRARAGEGKYQIGIISDTHGVGAYTYRAIDSNSYASCFRPIAVFNKIMQYCDAGIHGGDIACDYGTSTWRVLAYIRSVLRMFKFSSPFFITKGNHDENNNAYEEADMTDIAWGVKNYYTRSFSTFSAVTESTWNGGDLYVSNTALVTDKEFRNMAQHWLCPSGASWGDGAYYYYDLADEKIRVIVANSFPVNDSRQYEESDEYKWLAGALDLSAKATPTDWSVLILRHTQSTGISALSGCIYAFSTGGSWTYDGTTYNFGTINGGGIPVIAHIHGHEHGNCFSNGSGYFDIGENAAFTTRPGQADTYGLSVWTIDTVGHKVYEDTIDGKTWVYNYGSGRLEIKRGESFNAAVSGLSKPITVTCAESSITCAGSVVTIGNATPLGNYTVVVSGNGSGSYNYLITVVE